MNYKEIKNQIFEYNNSRFNKRFRLYMRSDPRGGPFLIVRNNITKEDISYFTMNEVFKAGNIPALMYLYKKGLVESHPVYTQRERIGNFIFRFLDKIVDGLLNLL